MKDFFSVLSGVLYLAGNLFMLRYIKRNASARPQWAPWLVFSLVETVWLGQMIECLADNWQIWGSALGSWLTLCATIKYRRPGFTSWDKICLVLAAISIIIWLGFGQVQAGLVITLLAAAIAMMPLIASAWNEPGSEDKTGWTFFWVSCLFASPIALSGEWSLANLGQPLSYLITETIITVIIWFPRARARDWLMEYRFTTNIGATVFETEW